MCRSFSHNNLQASLAYKPDQTTVAAGQRLCSFEECFHTFKHGSGGFGTSQDVEQKTGNRGDTGLALPLSGVGGGVGCGGAAKIQVGDGRRIQGASAP